MISIIIPTLNEEKILEKTLKSLKEFHGDYEIIVSDGKSKDKTIEIAKQYTNKVIIYDRETRQTIAMARNIGASIASGEYYVFIDADVLIPDINNFFAKIIQNFNKNNKLVGMGVFFDVNPEVATKSDKFFLWFFNWMFYILNNIFHYGALSGEFQFVKADIFKKLGGYNEKLVAGEDNEFFRRLSKIGQTRIDNTLSVFHPLRRAHKMGWIPLIKLWTINSITMILFKKSWSNVWEEVR
jgi:glycosyltransferase involved in cell wall biosynthesis